MSCPQSDEPRELHKLDPTPEPTVEISQPGIVSSQRVLKSQKKGFKVLDSPAPSGVLVLLPPDGKVGSGGTGLR